MAYDDRVALIDLDGTVADIRKAMEEQMAPLRAPGESIEFHPWDESTPHIKARLSLLKRQPGFWRNLERLELGFDVVDELRNLGFMLHVLTKAPRNSINAWSEKAEWARTHLPDAFVTVTQDKSLVYGRVLVDDFPTYFESWLAVRPRGQVISVAQPWNEHIRHPRVLRYDGTNRTAMQEVLRRAYDRNIGESG